MYGGKQWIRVSECLSSFVAFLFQSREQGEKGCAEELRRQMGVWIYAKFLLEALGLVGLIDGPPCLRKSEAWPNPVVRYFLKTGSVWIFCLCSTTEWWPQETRTQWVGNKGTCQGKVQGMYCWLQPCGEGICLIKQGRIVSLEVARFRRQRKDKTGNLKCRKTGWCSLLDKDFVQHLLKRQHPMQRQNAY